MTDSIPTVVSEPNRIARDIRDYLRAHPGLRKDEYRRDGDISLDGHCYVASEAYFHAHPSGGADGRLEVERITWENESTHWWLRDAEQRTVIDLIQPETPPEPPYLPYDDGTRTGFLTGYDTPSQRTQEVLDGIGGDGE